MVSFYNGYDCDNSTMNGISEVPFAAKERLTACKIDLVRKHPWLGHLVMTTEWQFTDEARCPRMAATTVPHNIVFVNAEWVKDNAHGELQSDAELNFIIAHEMMHIFLEHISRAKEGNYNPQLWNYATDYMINAYLDDLRSSVIKRPDWVLFDEKYAGGKSADEIYHMILEENDGDMQKAIESQGGTFEPDGQSQQGQGQGQSGDGQGQQGQGFGQGTNAKGQKLIDNVSAEDQSELSKNGNKQTLQGAMNNDTMAKQQGTGTANLFQLFEDLIESVIPWKDELSDFVTKCLKARRTYSKPSRRSRNIIFPGYTGEAVSVFYGTDSSGSMGRQDYLDAHSEMAGILEEFEGWSIALATCDTEAHFIEHYNSDEDDWDDVDFEIRGGGGTELSPMIDLAEDSNDEYGFGVCIIVTDGYIPEAPMEESCAATDLPVIVLVTRNGNKNLKLENARVINMDAE